MTLPKAAAAAQLPRSPLASLQRERINSPHLIVVHGLPGIGKTGFAAQFPDPIFACAEKRGADEQLIFRWPDPLEEWDGVRAMVRRLTDEDHAFKTLVIDKLEDVEPVCWKEILKLDPKGKTIMGEAFGGYQKAYDAAVDLGWRVLASELERLQSKRGMHVVLISHACRREFKDPMVENYDRWEPNVEKRAARFFVGWVRTVLFFDQDVATAKLDRGDTAKAKVVETGARVIRTERSAAYDAKNRLNLPPVIQMGADAVDAYAAWRAWTDPGELKKAIAERVKKLGDSDLAPKVQTTVSEAGDFTPDLARILHRLNALVSAKGA